MSSDRHSRAMNIGIATFIAFAVTVPELAAQHFQRISAGLGSAPFTDQDLRTIDDKLKLPGVIQTSSSVFDLAIEESQARAQATHFDSALEKARALHFEGAFAKSRTLARAIVLELDTQPESDLVTTSRDQALLLLARSELDLDDASGALRHLNMVTRGTPVDDFLLWLKADALTRLNNPAEAAVMLAAVVKQDTVLKPRAAVARARALYAAKDWEAAAKELRRVNDDFTLHPQRHELLYEEAFALEQIGKKQDAADVYLNCWFEFPYRKAGENAQLRLNALHNEGVAPSRIIAPKVLFDRYSRLRVNKHWDVAERLFKELQVDNMTPDMNSAFEHEISMQLALNDWGRRHFEDSLTRLLQLAEAWEKGDRAGISKKYVWRYIRRCYSQLGRLDEALAALEIENSGASMRTRLIERAELLEDHGRYEAAFEIYEAITSGSNKKGWHYTWLLYKTGRLEQAYENFTALANRSSGERRARNLYWAGRTLENDNRNNEAIEVWEQVQSRWKSSYYGIQSANRILDVKQRQSVDGTMLAQVVDIAAAGDEAIDAIEAVEPSTSSLNWESITDPRVALRVDAETLASLPQDDSMFAKTDTASELALAAMDRVLVTPLSLTDIVGTEDIAERDGDSANDSSEPPMQLKVPKTKLTKKAITRVTYTTSARMYWNGRLGSTTSFARYREGDLIGPLPAEPTAYDEGSYVGGISRAAAAASDVFPNLERAKWLWNAGMEKQARWLVRDVAIEFRELNRRYRAPSSRPHALDNGRWNYYIDNRRKDRSGLWGWKTDEARYPVPSSNEGKKALIARQQAIYDRKNDLREVLLDAFKEVGDHFMARKYTTEKGGWYRRDLNGPARTMWMQAYPRAFPNIVLREAHKNAVNPYLLWALMTVESSYNPDSVSPAQALGLLQVIPKTGLKTALMLDDEDFGPQDLVDEEVAIAHGAFYFSQLLRKFRGQELLAFAGYNGGPHRVGDWLDSRGNQPLDEFIEEIPFNEARGYAKKVARFVALFLRLYEQRDTLYIGQTMRSDYRAEPRF